MNDDEKDALKHAAKRGNGWILVEPGSALHKICSRLSESGMLEDRGAVEWCAGEIAYAITPAGRTEAKRQEEQDVPRLKRSQLMYRQFLNEDPGVRFMDWLRSRVKDPGKKSREMHIEKKKQKRKSISVRGDTYTRLAWYAHLQGKSVSSMVEEWIAGGIPADLVMPQLETRDVAAGRDAFRGTGTDRIRPLQHDDAPGLEPDEESDHEAAHEDAHEDCVAETGEDSGDDGLLAVTDALVSSGDTAIVSGEELVPEEATQDSSETLDDDVRGGGVLLL